MHPECEASVQFKLIKANKQVDLSILTNILKDKHKDGVQRNIGLEEHIIGVDFFLEGRLSDVVERVFKTLVDHNLLNQVQSVNVEARSYKITFDSAKELEAFETLYQHMFPTTKRSIFSSEHASAESSLISLSTPNIPAQDFSLYSPQKPEGSYQAMLSYSLHMITQDETVKSARYQTDRIAFFWDEGAIVEWKLRQAAIEEMAGQAKTKPKNKV